MKLFILLVVLASALCGTQAADTMYVSFEEAVGTKGDAVTGITMFDVNATTGKYTRREDFIETLSWPYMTIINKAGDRIYSIEDNESGTSDLVVYVKNENGLFEYDDSIDTDEDVYYLALDEAEEYLVLADFMDGYVELIEVGDLDEVDYFNVSSIDGVTASTSYPYQVQFVATQKNLVGVAYAGLDTVLFLEVDPTELKYSNPNLNATTAKNSFPVKFSFSDDGKFLYVLCLKSATVTVFQVNKNSTSGKIESFDNIQEIASLRDGDKGGEESWDTNIEVGGDARLQLHPNKKFLYAMSCAKQYIAMYEIDQTTGKLKSLGFQDVEGEWSFGMVLTPDGTKVVVSNEESDAINVYQVNQDSGLLSEIVDSRIEDVGFAGFIMYTQ